MNAYRANGGYSGMEYDRWVEQRASESNDKSAMAKLQQQFWVTKQTVFRKLGKKEDECIVASDAELDAKLELFRSIQESCRDLQRIIDKYQERLCLLCAEEGALGRFLKEAGRRDTSAAGKMMTVTGKALAYSAHQRMTLRTPLLRLHQEVETFRARAVEDTLQNVRAMEKLRNEYRAALARMKQLSSELDPETRHRLDKFRKVQSQVRVARSEFEAAKRDCVQKTDLLTAARCNMFSHALILYQAAMTLFSHGTSKAFTTVADAFQGEQPFEFTIVKELSELTAAPPSESPAPEGSQELPGKPDRDPDQLLFFEPDYRDEPESVQNDEPLLEIGNFETPSSLGEQSLLEIGDFGDVPLLDPGNFKADLDFGEFAPDLGPDSGRDWAGMLSGLSLGDLGSADNDLLDWGASDVGGQGFMLPSQLLAQTPQQKEPTMGTNEPTGIPKEPVVADQQVGSGPGVAKEKRPWLDLFAELDPLSDPDALAGPSDRNC